MHIAFGALPLSRVTLTNADSLFKSNVRFLRNLKIYKNHFFFQSMHFSSLLSKFLIHLPFKNYISAIL